MIKNPKIVNLGPTKIGDTYKLKVIAPKLFKALKIRLKITYMSGRIDNNLKYNKL